MRVNQAGSHLTRGGRIEGNITSTTLVVEEGGVFHGQSLMDGGAAASQAQAAAKQAASTSQETKGSEQVRVP